MKYLVIQFDGVSDRAVIVTPAVSFSVMGQVRTHLRSVLYKWEVRRYLCQEALHGCPARVQDQTPGGEETMGKGAGLSVMEARLEIWHGSHNSG